MSKKKNKRKTHRPASLHLALPATSANLGPAFDAAALAMDLYITIHARAASTFSIMVTGRDQEICRSMENHLILTTYQKILQAEGVKVTPLSLRINNDIPIGKGCGSSAAARLAGIALANHFGRLRWTDAQIVGDAAREALDQVGLSGEAEAQVVGIRPKGKWPLLLAIPDQALSTEEARRVLPVQYSRDDAVANIQNSLLLLAAFTQGRHELLSVALEDHIHQPYRAPLCPLLPCLQELTGQPGVLGVALSGAGPSVIVFLDPRCAARKTRESVAAHLARSGLHAELILTSITSRGIRR